MTLTTHQRWLLEVAVELRQPVASLSHPERAQIFNRTCPDLGPEAWMGLLGGLARDGLIERDGGYYGLTPAGGAAWEAFAQPDWARRIDASFDLERAEILCADAARLERYLAGRWLGCVPTGPVERDVVAPWRATYWGKTLPVGHRARLPCRWVDEAATGEYAERNAWLDDMNRWFEPV